LIRKKFLDYIVLGDCSKYSTCVIQEVWSYELIKLVKIASSEEKSEEFLIAKGELKTFTCCPFCGNKSIGKVRRNFFRCHRCKKEWSVRKDSILENMKISLKSLFWLKTIYP